VSGYRERRDPREIAFELLREAYAREAQALVVRHEAETALKLAEHEREAAWQMLGARTNLVRHLLALEKSFADARTRASRDPGSLAAVEAERAAFLRERGVEPGPALTEPRGEVAADLEKARAEVAAVEQEIRAADECIASARADFERAHEALAEATRARVKAQAEAASVSGPSA